MELRKDFTVPAAPYDVAVSDAGLAFVSGGDGDWTDVSVVDAAKEAIVARWGGVWNRSFLRLSADQKRLYVSSQGVKPGTLDALPLPDKLDRRAGRVSRRPRRRSTPWAASSRRRRTAGSFCARAAWC